MHGRSFQWAVTSAALFWLWILFVSKLEWHEILIGLGAAVLGTAGSEAVRRTEHPRFIPHIRWVLEAWRVPGLVLAGCWVLLKKLWRELVLRNHSPGLFRAVRFDSGGRDEHATARRVLAITFTTLPPNFIIIYIDRRQNLLLFHQVEKEPVPAVTRRLGAMVPAAESS